MICFFKGFCLTAFSWFSFDLFFYNCCYSFINICTIYFSFIFIDYSLTILHIDFRSFIFKHTSSYNSSLAPFFLSFNSFFFHLSIDQIFVPYSGTLYTKLFKSVFLIWRLIVWISFSLLYFLSLFHFSYHM